MDPSPTDRRPCALVVDDDVLVRMTALDILEDAGFRTFEAENAEEALAVLHGHHVSIVVLFTDVNMPGAMDGFRLARETAQHWPHVSILVASGRHKPGPGEMPEGRISSASPSARKWCATGSSRCFQTVRNLIL